MSTSTGFVPDPAGFIYKQMADHLEARIRAGEFVPNRPLPAERRLAEEYFVSLGTARRATGLLRERSLVRTVRSKGTFALPRRKIARTVSPPRRRRIPGVTGTS